MDWSDKPFTDPIEMYFAELSSRRDKSANHL
jgi:hypothetical protein